MDQEAKKEMEQLQTAIELMNSSIDMFSLNATYNLARYRLNKIFEYKQKELKEKGKWVLSEKLF